MAQAWVGGAGFFLRGEEEKSAIPDGGKKKRIISKEKKGDGQRGKN